MVNYVEGLKRPFSDVKKLVIGIIISIIPIVNLLAVGYGVKCADMVLKKKKKVYPLPEWKDWANLFVDGVTAVVIGLVYALPALVVAFFAFSSIMINMMSGSNTDFFLAMAQANISLVLLTILLLFAASILTPMALMNFIKKRRFGAAFEFKNVFAKITGKYLVVWVAAILFSIVLSGILDLLGFIGNGISAFFIIVITYTWFAEAYSGRY